MQEIQPDNHEKDSSTYLFAKGKVVFWSNRKIPCVVFSQSGLIGYATDEIDKKGRKKFVTADVAKLVAKNNDGQVINVQTNQSFWANPKDSVRQTNWQRPEPDCPATEASLGSLQE